MKKSIALLLAALLCLGGITAFAASEADIAATLEQAQALATDASLQKVLSAGQLVLGLDDAFPPMGYRDEKGEIVGFDIDVATEVAARLGIKLAPQPIDWSTKEAELNAGAVDCIWNGLTITPERQEAMRISLPYLANEQVVAVRQDDAAQTLADLAGRTLGLQAGSSAVDALNANPDLKTSLAEVAEFDDYLLAMMDLEQGGVDAVLIDSIVANYYLTIKGGQYRLLGESVATESFGIAFRKGDELLAATVEATLLGMAADGKLAEISTKWFGSDVTVLGK
ncbi:MAG: amino acid ABC transporter substrate-binding protein [Oscillospiraceae bacterium]|nr:amino acid ABC transporter substrate-binding protein [Oscillospiraceae bacterium]